MLQDPKLVRRLFEEEAGLVRVSPYFLFTVLLLQVRRDLEETAYVLEVDFKGKRILNANVIFGRRTRTLDHKSIRPTCEVPVSKRFTKSCGDETLGRLL
jgi:hypothetical protein